MQWYVDVLKKYAVFSGRARRKEYWMFTLVSVAVSVVLYALDRVIGTDYGNNSGLLSGIYSVAVLIPALAVTWRRLHDTDRRGWWILIGLLPVIGTIALIVILALDSTPGDNRFGPNPKAAESSGAYGTQPGYGTA
ncbi:protein of unknown function DUF805 [Kribbella flavida DSM 17836]|uniref:DUF805 domain-containing protein n=1 Tax=Kribbella flavida (strain DSM 17836 / JCM 10339 / NBRC 14399) TaxID=479435 RepID=D2PY46_KRIFD|nr:DUF805 domain-containing protein [Kribbella flavida]ADB33652.1 protein of unknown function DUF805 [Kribbella flavida DSM 17836]